MSFVRLTADDFVVSTDAISATAWTTGNPTLSTFFTSSTQENGSSGDYYLNIYNTGSDYQVLLFNLLLLMVIHLVVVV
jgi:hypothetical protein